MDNFYLFESGATKTALLYVKDGQKHERKLPGFNPNISNNLFEIALKESVGMVEGADVVFYGSGLGSDANKEVVHKLFESHDPASVTVLDDIIGAARAAFKNQAGIICIMGTGGLAAYYNGRVIEKRRGGYGYLIDDLGGGFELGKRMMSAWLNQDIPEEISEHLTKELGNTAKDYSLKIYQTKKLDLVSGIVPYFVDYKEHPFINQLLTEYFTEFVNRDVLPLTEAYGISSFSVVGSVGTGFYSVLREVAKQQHLSLEQCIQNPIQRLFEYHLP
jgi:hypothetical protein